MIFSRPLLCLLLLLSGGCQAAPVPEVETVVQRPPHHTEDGFRNPYAPPSDKGPFAFWRMKWFGEEDWPSFAEARGQTPRTPVDRTRLQHPGAAPQVTWIGHATVLIQYRGVNILTDPVFSNRASPVGWAGPRRYTPLPLTVEQLPPIHLVLLSHNHYDALDEQTVQALGDGPLWAVPLGHRDWFKGVGIAPERVVEFDWWQARELAGVRVTATPTQHWSKRSLWDTNHALWCGWAVQWDDFSLWFAGDTGYNPVQFREIGQRFDGFDLALIPIGGYAPRGFMQRAHIDPEEAVRIFREIGARYALGIHWGTFILTAEPVDEPPRRLRQALSAAGLPPTVFEAWAVGETRAFPLTDR